jgi:hypothetical protein
MVSSQGCTLATTVSESRQDVQVIPPVPKAAAGHGRKNDWQFITEAVRIKEIGDGK